MKLQIFHDTHFGGSSCPWEEYEKDLAFGEEVKEIPSVRGSLEVLGSSLEPFRRREGCFCYKCKSPSEVTKWSILHYDYLFKRKLVTVFNLHGLVDIVHFFVEIVVHSGYWIHFGLDWLHFRFKTDSFTISLILLLATKYNWDSCLLCVHIDLSFADTWQEKSSS